MEYSNPICDEFYERFHPDTFKKCLSSNPDIYCCINHDYDTLLGRTANKTLRIDNRTEGLFADCDNPGTSYANDLAILIGRGDVAGMSFIFRYKEIGPPERHLGLYAITVMEADISEVCFTFRPAYPTTDAAMRSQLHKEISELDTDDSDDGQKLRMALMLRLRERETKTLSIA